LTKNTHKERTDREDLRTTTKKKKGEDKKKERKKDK